MEIRSLGLVPYAPVVKTMRDFTLTRQPDTEDELWLLQHEPVFTQGQAGRDEHVHDAGPIEVLRSDRGGQVTYHGPGQIIVYTLLDIRRAGLHIRQLISLLESAIINTLASLGIRDVCTNPKAPGVYVGDSKIAALGLRISKSCSYHGLSLNVDMDLSPFERIDPCGFKQKVTQVVDHSHHPAATDAKQVGFQLADELCALLSQHKQPGRFGSRKLRQAI